MGVETLAGFTPSVFGVAGCELDHHLGLIACRLLDYQSPAGNWRVEPLAPYARLRQGEYLRGLYRRTWA
jgi:hypothetical protein